MRASVLRLVAASLPLAIACGGMPRATPSTPVAPDPVPPIVLEGGVSTLGRTVQATTGAGAPNVSIEGTGIVATRSGADGAFTLQALAESEPRRLSFGGPGFITRRTFIRIPGPEALVSLIPAGFDLGSFDQMFRVMTLQRWTRTPPLRIELRTLEFTDLAASEFTALSDRMSEAEYESLVQDLQWALPQLTGQSYNAFASLTPQLAAVEARVPVLNEGAITVARVTGLTQATGFWGYGRWRVGADGSVIGGMCVLDAAFDRSASPFVRSLRAHELGHALGYHHVSGRISVMNADSRTEPNDFDRLAATVAFQRHPGNRSPDEDATPASSVNRMIGRWGPPLP